jgi:hypothetical protein
MWNLVDGWLAAPGIAERFAGWPQLLNRLHTEGVLEVQHARVPTGPANLGPRPTFTAHTKHSVETAADENIRHIVSSSSLGKAIESAQAGFDDLNGWLSRHAEPVRPTGALDVDKRNAKVAIWKVVHNHRGNLFPGPGGSNQAAGLIRGPLLAVIESSIRGKEQSWIPLSEIKLPIKPQFGWKAFAEHWTLIIVDLQEELNRMATDPQHPGSVPGHAAKSLIQQYVDNVDLDLPFTQMRPQYFEKLHAVYGDILLAPPTMFQQGEPLDQFMALDWRAA